jgi:single-stranded DNA-specific DHH superfamily exonuclease
MTGSCRSIPGVDIHAALTAVKHHLVRYGGHKQAAGLTLSSENLDAFRADIDAYLSETIPAACYIPDFEYDMQMGFSELTAAFVAELEALSPTGFGNPAPVLRASAYTVDARAVGAEGAHLKLTLSESGVQKNGIFFREGALADLIMIDLRKPHLQPINDPVADLVYCAKASDVELVVVDGEMVVEERKVRGVELEKLYQRAAEAVDRITSA